MDLKQLEYFLTCANYGSLTKAADALYTTQPHVSMVIRALETELGVKLFDRKSNGIALTEAGRNIYIYAENALKNTDTIRKMVREPGKNSLKIASNPSSYMASILSEYYHKLNEENVELTFTEGGIEWMMDVMLKEHYDLGFLFAPVDRLFALNMKADHRRLEYVELFRSDLVLHVADSHPLYERDSLDANELFELSYVQFVEDYFTISELLSLDTPAKGTESNRQKSFPSIIETNSDHLIVQMLKKGSVVNLGSFWLKDRFREYPFKMIPVNGYENTISFGYLKQKGRPLRKPAEDFMEFLKTEVLFDRM